MTRRASRGLVWAATLGILTSLALLVRPTATQLALPPIRPTVTIDGRLAAAGDVLVRYRRSLTVGERAQLDQQLDADENEPVGGTGIRRIHSSSMDTAELLAFLRANPDVAYAEPNYIVAADVVPNDPWFGQLWGLLNVGQTVGTPGTPGADIGATQAWTVSTGSRTSVVAVIDTGIDYTHPDLGANIWSAPAAFSVNIAGQMINCPAGTHGFNAITKSCGVLDVFDDNGHGTHVAGTIGALGNNGTGVVGVNWTTSIMASKFLDSTGSGTLADSINAIEFVIQAAAATGANVRVLSNSWSSGGFSQALLDEINSANARDMLFVASAGNNTADNDSVPRYPSGYDAPNVISVASTDNNDRLASNSNYGATSVHLAAPGVNILSTYPDGAYQYLSGTSMAVPHVSGAAALLLSHCVLSTSGLRNALLSTVDRIPLLAGKVSTGGRLDVNTAIHTCEPPPSPEFSLSGTPSTDTMTAGTSTTFTATISPSGGFAGTVTLGVSGLPSGVTGTFAPPSITTSGSSILALTSSPATAAGNYPLTITATSGALVHTATVTLVVQSATALTVDTVVFADGVGTRTRTLSTSAAPELILAFVGSDGPSASAQTMTVSGAGLTWSLVRRVNTQAGTSEIWQANAPSILTNATVTSTQAFGGFVQSLTVVTFSGAAGVGASAAANGATGAPSVSLTPTQTGSLLYAVGNDWSAAIARTLAPDQTLVHELVDTTARDTFWVQTQTAPVSTPGTPIQLRVAAPTFDRWNLAAVEIKPATPPVFVTVPNVVNQTQAAATAAITSAGLAVGSLTTASSTTVPAGAIISQNPAAGTQVTIGSAVALLVSTGPPMVAVPDVVNQTQAAATAAITSAGLAVGALTTASSTTVPAGAVISQNPAAGTQVALGSTVALLVSSGPPLVAVPNVVSLTQSAATAALTSAGLAVGTVTTASSTTVPAGAVISQNPAAGTQMPVGSLVALVVSTGPPTDSDSIAIDQIIFADGKGAQTTRVFSTTAPGGELIALVASDGSASGGQTLTVSGAGLQWTLVQRANAQAGTAEIWRATATAPLSNVTVTSTPAQSGYDQSLTLITFVNASVIGASAKQSASAGAPSIALTTTKPLALVFGVGSDWDNAIGRTLRTGQTMAHQWVDTAIGDTFWSQMTATTIDNAGTTVTMGVTAPTTDRWNFAVVEVAAAATPPLLITVPNVIALTQSAATNAITAAGLTVGTITTTSSTTVPAGFVISQNPTAGTQVASGSAVALAVSSGPPLVAVPNVVSLTQSAAANAITAAGLTVGTITTASSTMVPAGSVISQHPTGGTQVVPGSPVAMVVSSGPPPVTIDQAIFSDGRGTRTTQPFSTTVAGQVLIAFVSSDGPSSPPQTMTMSGAGLPWTLVQRSNTQAGTSEVWRAVAGTPLTNATVTSTPSVDGYDQSLTLVTFFNASGVGASAKQSAVTGAASATLTTTKNGALVFGVGNDWDDAVARTLPAGHTMVHQWVDSAVGDTFWVQTPAARIDAAGAVVTLGITAPTADRWNFAVVEIVP